MRRETWKRAHSPCGGVRKSADDRRGTEGCEDRFGRGPHCDGVVSLHVEDRALLDRVLAGEPPAQAELYDRTIELVRRVISRVMLVHGPMFIRARFREELDDRTQEFYGQLFARNGRVLRRWDPARGGLNTYFRMLAYSRTIEFIRHEARRWKWERPLSDPDMWDVMHLEAPDVEDQYARAELLEAAFAELKRSMGRERAKMFHLLFEQGLDVAEIVVQAQKSAAAVHQAACRIRRQMREIVDRLSGGEVYEMPRGSSP